MPTADERHALQLENAKQDAKFWAGLQDMHAANIDGNKALVAGINQRIAETELEKAKVVANAESAKDRLARIKRSENVSGFGKPITRKDVERAVGKAFLRRACQLNELCEAVHTGFDEL